MSANIEALVVKHCNDLFNPDVTGAQVIRNALTEQAETHAIELRAYEATVANLNERIRQMEGGWIPVSERLPNSDVSFLAITDCAGDIHITTMRLPVLIAKNEMPDGDLIRERVTHWMPLPAIPKKEGRWNQFARIDTPEKVWAECLDSDLHMLEETKESAK